MFRYAVEEVTSHEVSLFKVGDRPEKGVGNYMLIHFMIGGIEKGYDLD